MNNPYDLQPEQYNFDNLNVHGVYDQFLYLRDTFIFSGKKYTSKAGCKLVVGDKEKTIEVLWNNIFQMNFESITDWDMTKFIKGPYTTWSYEIASNVPFGPMSCIIKKDGLYKIIHKEEVLPAAGSSKVICYVDIYREDPNGSITVFDKKYSMPYKGGVAVFDWQGEFSKTYTGTISGTCHGEGGGNVTGSCSVNVNFKLGDILQKVTAFGYMEINLKEGDILVLRNKDAEPNTDGSPAGNNLTLQTNSNYWSIEYLNLPYNS